jgi:hypothetical protein
MMPARAAEQCPFLFIIFLRIDFPQPRAIFTDSARSLSADLSHIPKIADFLPIFSVPLKARKIGATK